MSKKLRKQNKTFKEIQQELSEKEKVPVFDFKQTETFFPPEPEEPGVNKKLFSWKFSDKFCDLSNQKYGWHKATPDKLFFSALDKLQYYERITWNELMKLKSAHYHEVPFDKLTENIQKKISSFLHTENGDVLCQIAGKDRHRIIGVKQGAVFYPVWNDELHEVYNM